MEGLHAEWHIVREVLKGFLTLYVATWILALIAALRENLARTAANVLTLTAALVFALVAALVFCLAVATARLSVSSCHTVLSWSLKYLLNASSRSVFEEVQSAQGPRLPSACPLRGRSRIVL